ncbi:DMT family transporter [Bacteroides stercorirosoris]|uniref:DMT family transporter n=1 Tax=Bacteroides stercorirosoris TaxID=871324 RepID=A0A413H9C7_9BACE|nr:DMT family transporter [Bacteroides stercorirosoris]OKZ10903.1 MAG: EamA family transporter [Bacteroides oleiciplenus]RGX80278.1 DMT family transporter [Bacteroides stercorirosoris]
MNKNVQGHIFALTANILWGLMAPIGKSALMEFSALSVTTFRMVGAAACFWLLSAFCKREHVDHRDMLKIFFASLFALVFNQGVYIFGLSMTSPIDASIVTTTLPIVTMIIAAIYLKEPVTNLKVLGIFVGAMGALILIMSSQTAGGGNSSIIGDLLCLVAQISFSIYLTVFKGLSQKYSPITLNKWMFVYASMCYIPFSYHDVASIQWAEISTAAFVQVGYVVVGGSFLAYIFIMTAQRLMRPTVVSMYNYMQPIVASIAAIIMGLGVFGWEKGAAIALVFLGVYIVTKSKSKADFEKAGKEV